MFDLKKLKLHADADALSDELAVLFSAYSTEHGNLEALKHMLITCASTAVMTGHEDVEKKLRTVYYDLIEEGNGE